MLLIAISSGHPLMLSGFAILALSFVIPLGINAAISSEI